MSDAIGPGDWVECIEARAGLYPGQTRTAGFVVGALYRVSECYMFLSGPRINLFNMPHPRDLGLMAIAWDASAFRPISQPQARITRRALKCGGA